MNHLQRLLGAAMPQAPVSLEIKAPGKDLSACEERATKTAEQFFGAIDFQLTFLRACQQDEILNRGAVMFDSEWIAFQVADTTRPRNTQEQS